MAVPKEYFEAEGWWFGMAGMNAMPKKSIFPDGNGGPGWVKGDIPREFGGRPSSIQGWKLHVCAHPEDIEGLFLALSPVLGRRRLAHKFLPFPEYS